MADPRGDGDTQNAEDQVDALKIFKRLILSTNEIRVINLVSHSL